MSSRSGSTHFDHDHLSRPSVSEITAVAVTEWTPRRRNRDSYNTRSGLLDGNPPEPRPYAGLYAVPSPRADSDGVQRPDHSVVTARRFRRGSPNLSTLDNAASTKKAILDDRFEKMLALLDVDDSDSDSDRRHQVKPDGDGTFLASSSAGHVRVCLFCATGTINDADRIADQLPAFLARVCAR